MCVGSVIKTSKYFEKITPGNQELHNRFMKHLRCVICGEFWERERSFSETTREFLRQSSTSVSGLRKDCWLWLRETLSPGDLGIAMQHSNTVCGLETASENQKSNVPLKFSSLKELGEILCWTDQSSETVHEFLMVNIFVIQIPVLGNLTSAQAFLLLLKNMICTLAAISTKQPVSVSSMS